MALSRNQMAKLNLWFKYSLEHWLLCANFMSCNVMQNNILITAWELLLSAEALGLSFFSMNSLEGEISLISKDLRDGLNCHSGREGHCGLRCLMSWPVPPAILLRISEVLQGPGKRVIGSQSQVLHSIHAEVKEKDLPDISFYFTSYQTLLMGQAMLAVNSRSSQLLV